MAKNPYINIYAGDPTEGEKDGFAISSDGSFSAPLSVLFDVSFPDLVDTRYQVCYKVVKLAVRLEEGFAVNGGVGISVPFYGPWRLTVDDPTLAARWENAVSRGGITDVNTIFYARVSGSASSPTAFGNGHDSDLTLHAKIFPL